MELCWARIDSFHGNFSSLAVAFHRPCPVCGEIRSWNVLELPDFQFYSDSIDYPKRVDVRQNQCRRCFALYLNPCYSDYGFRSLFSEARRSYGSKQDRPEELVSWMRDRSLLQSGTSMLDVGCFEGTMVACVPQDVRRFGIDIDSNAIAHALKLHASKGIEFVLGDLEHFQCATNFDVITMFHVLEHLPQPLAVLKNLRQRSRPATRLVIEVPVLEQGTTNDINGFLSVQHTIHFSETSLVNLLMLTGWDVLEFERQSDHNGYRVLAAPDNRSLQYTCNPQDRRLLLRYLSAWYDEIHLIESRLLEFAKLQRCVIWGGGLHTEFVYQLTSFFEANPTREYIIVDSDPLKIGRTWRGISICE